MQSLKLWIVLCVVSALIACGTEEDTTALGTEAQQAGLQEIATAQQEPVEAATSEATSIPPTAVAETGSDVGCITRPGATASENELASLVRLAGVYAEQADRCPTEHVLEELRYIWEQNGEYWTAFPAQEAGFFRSNVDHDFDGVRPELVGLTFEAARSALVDDADFPMVQDRGPILVDDMTLYEFSGGRSVLLGVVRNDTVTRIYLFDQT